MDTARTQSAARDGSGLRQGEMVQGASKMVGDLGSRSPHHCPYDLGAHCPFMEDPKERSMMSRAEQVSKVVAVVVGLSMTVALIMAFD